MLQLENKTVLITGGTGSFGRKFVREVLHRHPTIKKLIIFSRDELKQYEMSLDYPKDKYNQVRFFLGDIRDRNRLFRAFEGVDIVVHAAALKQVPAAEYNPFEFINTNIIGSENVINAALDSGVENVVALSTDKAAAPINLYGATKLCSDKLFIAANNVKGVRNCKFSIVRYGNVLGSRGSVIPLFLKQKEAGRLTITDPNMTRFSISLEDGVNLVMNALDRAIGGEIFVPKIPSYRVKDVAEAIAPEAEHEIVGIRPGEKVHEEMITKADAYNTLETEHYYLILPVRSEVQKARHEERHGKSYVVNDFNYSSGTNTDWLSVDEIRQAIVKHVNPGFKV
ncbi:MAG: UDP-N-acetylglucosamine 4,6-dehydratase (inverting) [Cytophagales bacterium]|nr:UDP-N-acetylglucosamine 4,6-dehydratase (inverting) [Cytophagales bacterium]